MTGNYDENSNHLVEGHEMDNAGCNFSTRNHFSHPGKMVRERKTHCDSVVWKFRNTQSDGKGFRCKSVIMKIGKDAYHV